MLALACWVTPSIEPIPYGPKMKGSLSYPYLSRFSSFQLIHRNQLQRKYLQSFVLLGGSYCTYSFVFRRKRLQVLHLLKFLPVFVHNFAAAHHVLRSAGFGIDDNHL